MFKKILVAIDLSRHAAAASMLETAARLASAEGGEVFYLSVRPEDDRQSAEEFRHALQAFAEEQHERHGLTGGWLAYIDDEVDEGVRRGIESLRPDLLVVGAHQPKWLEIFTGPSIRDFVADSDVSILIAR